MCVSVELLININIYINKIFKNNFPTQTKKWSYLETIENYNMWFKKMYFLNQLQNLFEKNLDSDHLHKLLIIFITALNLKIVKI